MLTLQQLLESDSLATIVAKLNQNFQSLSLSNGGPQGIIGKQGIPGLPGRVGPMGVTGPQGPTGTIAGIIPFSAIPGTGTTAGPESTITEVPAFGTVAPWPQSSWQWLKKYHSNGVTLYGVPHVGGDTPKAGDIYIDHANKGYWKFLDQPDEPGAHDEAAVPPYSQGGAYSSTGAGSTYPDLGTQLGWVGPGWYYYPPGNTDKESLNNVWIHDTSTYLLSNLGQNAGVTGPYKAGPNPDNDQTLAIPNARLISKYGSVWITSGNDATDSGDDQVKDTSTIGLWGYGSGVQFSQPARNNSGIDRLLFKMSLDGLPYLSNVVARGLLPTDPLFIAPDGTYPQTLSEDQMEGNTYWVAPFNGITMDKFSPLLFLTQRDDQVTGPNGTYGSLGIYMYTSTATKDLTVPQIPDGLYGAGTAIRNNNVSKTLHLFSSRYSVDPIAMFTGGGLTPIKSNATRNYGEMLLDFRRVVASNQYVCSLPTDLKLSSDYLAGTAPDAGDADTRYYDENSSSNTAYKFKTTQGYISAINGKAMTGLTNTADYWEYGLGTDIIGTGSQYTSGTHDSASGTAGMRTRRTWYGSSVLREKPSLWNTSPYDATDYIRVAGMMERGRRVKWDENSGNYNKTAFLSELIFYTSAFSVNKVNLVNGVGVTNDVIDPKTNAHKSLPSMYVSPYTNIGIGTFVGGYLASNDQGPQEPAAKLHVHLKETTGLDDPTSTFLSLTNGTGVYANLPTKTYAVAAFSGAVNPSIKKGNIDILLGALSSATVELASGYEKPVNSTIGTNNQLRNAIRSESWGGSNYYTNNLSTLRLGAQPYAASSAIGRGAVSAFRNEFQISLHPLNVRSTDLSSSLTSISGVGIHNMYPRARVHFFGSNTYNETEYGVQQWRPGYMSAAAGATFPYYGASSVNSASANQVIIDYIGDSYKYPVGLYEYQYYVYGLTDNNPVSTGSSSPNSAVYPNKEILSPTRFAVPYGDNQFYNQSYPSTLGTVRFNGSYKHGGTENAWWEPSSFIGFNLYRDLSNADGNTLGDNKDTTKWILGTQGTDGINHGNNGGAGIISSNTGELGIITIPRGRDGGRAYEEWEQRGLGTRDVLNQMKIIFDKNGNIAIGNAAGWDLDAYPSVDTSMATGYVNYLSIINAGLNANALISGPFSALNALSSRDRFGRVSYTSINSTLYAESPSLSSAALINKRATVPEYIRLEVGAEKAWSRDGRMAQKLGFGYPANATIVIPDSLIAKYVRNSYSITPTANQTSWTLTTDAEGRIVNNTFQFRIPNTLPANAPTPTASTFVVIFPHPSEFVAGGPLASVSGVPANFVVQTGAMAAEWWGMSTDSPIFNSSVLTTTPQSSGASRSGWIISFIPTTDTKGSANVRLNNFVYGEGYGFSTNNQESTGVPRPQIETEYTKNLVRLKRQESPKLILSFLEKTPNSFEAAQRTQSGSDPYLKVSTIIASAQNESAMREYWIPKTDNTGGTFMVFTDHFGKKEKDSGFDEESIVIKQETPGVESTRVGLHLEEVVTQEFLASYDDYERNPQYVTDMDLSVISDQSFLRRNEDGYPIDMTPGYVRYYNKSYNKPGQPTVFASGIYGQLVDVAPYLTSGNGGGNTMTLTTSGNTPKAPAISTFRGTALSSGGDPNPQFYGNSYGASLWNPGTIEYYDSDYPCCGTWCGGTRSKNFFGWATKSSADHYVVASASSTQNTLAVYGDISWINQNTGKITPPSGNYEVIVKVGSYTCSNGGRLINLSSSDFNCNADANGRVVSLALYKNGSLVSGGVIASSSSSTCSDSCSGNIALPANASKTFNVNANGTDYFEIRWVFEGTVGFETGCLCSAGVSCEKNAMLSETGFAGGQSFSFRSLQGSCDSNSPSNEVIKMAIGFNGSVQSYFSTAFEKPMGTYFPCPGQTFYNVDDNYFEVGAAGNKNGSIASLNEDYFPDEYDNKHRIVFDRNQALTSLTGDYDRIKITINMSARAPRANKFYGGTHRALVLRFTDGSKGSGHSSNTLGGFCNSGNGGAGSPNNSLYIQRPDELDVLYGVIPGKLTGDGYNSWTYNDGSMNAVVTQLQTPGVITGTWVYDGECEIYMSKAQWESNASWLLCGALLLNDVASNRPNETTGLMDSWHFDYATQDNNSGLIPPDKFAWEFEKFSVKFEQIIDVATSQSTANTTQTIPLSPTAKTVDRSSIRRNIDYFYSIYSPTTNYDDGWNTEGNTENVPEINNHASSIRMKRINSEFALVDFNITVKVSNPYLGGGTAADSLIDFGSPRFTQYLRFTYIPDEAFYNEGEYGQDIAQDLFGNGMWFSNWSSYKNWLPGTGIVGSDINESSLSNSFGIQQDYNGGNVGFQSKNISSDWSPTFNDINLAATNQSAPFIRSWNGNLLEMLAFRNNSKWQEMAVLRGSADYGILSNPLGNISGTWFANNGTGQGVFSAFGNDGRMLKIANAVFNLTGQTGWGESHQKQKAFAGYLGGMYALWGNQAFERNSNVQWRMSPAYNYIDESTVESQQITNNGFTLEVQFSKPILHVDTPLGSALYGYYNQGENNSSLTVKPYQYLTVSGQGIVRYAQTLKVNSNPS